jgi:hypothetical protein
MFLPFLHLFNLPPLLPGSKSNAGLVFWRDPVINLSRIFHCDRKFFLRCIHDVVTKDTGFPRFFAEFDINRRIPCFIAEIPNFAVFSRFRHISHDLSMRQLTCIDRHIIDFYSLLIYSIRNERKSLIHLRLKNVTKCWLKAWQLHCVYLVR